MDTTSVFLFILAGILITSLILYLFFSQKKQTDPSSKHGAGKETLQMQLAAYERLILLVDRIAIHNLISRVSQTHLNARDMQLLLTESIKQEFNHNITQQLYVSADAWTAVKNLKEQNQLIINQLANVLPSNATGLDLNKLLLEYQMNDKKGTLHEIVSEVLNYEAKKLL